MFRRAAFHESPGSGASTRRLVGYVLARTNPRNAVHASTALYVGASLVEAYIATFSGKCKNPVKRAFCLINTASPSL